MNYNLYRQNKQRDSDDVVGDNVLFATPTVRALYPMPVAGPDFAIPFARRNHRDFVSILVIQDSSQHKILLPKFVRSSTHISLY